MKTALKMIIPIEFLICICCSLSRWIVKPEHLAVIDPAMAVSFLLLVTSLIIEDILDA